MINWYLLRKTASEELNDVEMTKIRQFDHLIGTMYINTNMINNARNVSVVPAHIDVNQFD